MRPEYLTPETTRAERSHSTMLFKDDDERLALERLASRELLGRMLSLSWLVRHARVIPA
jgi:hypothetical protein